MMRKWWKRSEKRILVTMLAFLCLFNQFSTDVSASTSLGSVVYDFSYTFPVVYGTYDNSIEVTSCKTFACNLPAAASVGSYYVVTVAGNPSRNTEFKYVQQEDTKQFVDIEYVFTYGGLNYEGSGVYNTSFLIEGMNTSSMSLEIYCTTLLSPYWASDGYVYANESQTYFSWNPTVYLHRYEPEELPLAKQLVQIVNYLNNISSSNTNISNNTAYITEKLHAIMGDVDSLENKVSLLYDLLVEVFGQDNADKIVMDKFEQNSSSQSSQLGQLNQENKVDKIDINNASSTVDSNINLDAVGSSGVVLSVLTGHQKILTMLLGVTAISLIAYVFFGKR